MHEALAIIKIVIAPMKALHQRVPKINIKNLIIYGS
jgi:hypothetical protein